MSNIAYMLVEFERKEKEIKKESFPIETQEAVSSRIPLAFWMCREKNKIK